MSDSHPPDHDEATGAEAAGTEPLPTEEAPAPVAEESDAPVEATAGDEAPDEATGFADEPAAEAPAAEPGHEDDATASLAEDEGHDEHESHGEPESHGEHGEHEGHGEHEEHDDEHLTLREALRERLVRLEGMEPTMKLLLGAVVAQLAVAAVLIALKGVSMPSIVGDATSDTDFSDIPDVVFVLAMLGFCTAWTLVLAGVYRGGWLLRTLVCAAFGWAFWDVRSVFDGESSWGPAGSGACLIAVLLLAIATYFPERRYRREAAEAKAKPVPSKGLHRLRLLTPFVLFVLIGGACGIAWLAAASADKIQGIGHTDVNSNAVAFTTTFSYLLSNHQYVLIPLLVLAGAEFGEWGDFVSRRLIRFVRRPSRGWILAGVTVVVAGLMVFDGIHVSNGDEGGGLQPEGLLGLAVIGTLVLLWVLAKPSGKWSAKVPFLAIAFVAIVDTVSGFIAQDRLNADDQLLGEKIYGVSDLVWLVAAVICLVVLAVRRRKLSATWVNAGVFIVLVGATETLQALPELGTVVHPFGLNIDNGSVLGLEGIIGDLAIATILLVLVAAATRRIDKWETPITISLVMLLGLEAVYRIDHLFGRATSIAGNLAIAAAVLMVVALTWEFLSSGESITNDDTPRFSRSTRLFVFSGYVLLVAVSVLYYSDLHLHGTNNVIESEFDSEEWVREGILFLGVPIVLSLALARFERWRLGLKAGETVEEQVEEALLPAGLAVEYSTETA
jgi:hypothetical protein